MRVKLNKEANVRILGAGSGLHSLTQEGLHTGRSAQQLQQLVEGVVLLRGDGILVFQQELWSHTGETGQVPAATLCVSSYSILYLLPSVI